MRRLQRYEDALFECMGFAAQAWFQGLKSGIACHFLLHTAPQVLSASLLWAAGVHLLGAA
jgi:hypothetical protein